MAPGQVLEDKARRSEVITEQATGELGREELVVMACQSLSPCVETAVVAAIATICVRAVMAAVAMSPGWVPTRPFR
jgi:hypothetical protein